jgi:hypothetical protein
MDSELKESSFSESFQCALNRCCEAQVECTTQITKVTCEVWSKAMACYVVGVTRGLGGLVNCYIAGVECFYKTLENVAEELCDEKNCKIRPEDPDDRKVKEAKTEFYMALEKAFEPFFKTLETQAENLGKEHGKLSQAEFYKTMGGCLEPLGHIKPAEFSKFLEIMADNLGDIKTKIKKAVSSQALSMKPNKSKKKVTAKKKVQAKKMVT